MFWDSKFFFSLLVALGFFATNCGIGPEPIKDPPQTPTDNRTQIGQDHTTECGANATGPDCDGDGLTDACAEILGFPICDPDCDDDGTTNRFDNPLECDDDPSNDDDECTTDECRERTESLFRDPDFWNGMNMAAGAFSGTAPPGSSIDIEKQILVFGPLTTRDETGEKGVNWSDFPAYANLVTLKGLSACEQDSSIYFMANGTVNGQPAKIELCGELKTANGTGLVLGTNRNDEIKDPLELDDLNLQLDSWKHGKAAIQGFDFNALKLAGATTITHFKGDLYERAPICPPGSTHEKCTGDKNEVVYDKLDLELASDFTIKYKTLYTGMGYVTTETEVVKNSWKRTGDLTDQLWYSKGLRGVWINVCKRTFTNIFCD